MNATDTPMIEVRLVFADRTQVHRYWTMDEMVTAPKALTDQLNQIPEFLLEPRKSWQHPQDPIVYSALVQEGKEAEARAWLDSLWSPES